MKQNVGILDTAIRSVIACLLMALAFETLYSPAVNLILGGIGFLLFMSSSFGICLVYKIFGIDTYPDFHDDSYHTH